MSDNYTEQELREMVEGYIANLLSSAKEEKRTNLGSTEDDRYRLKCLTGMIVALERLEPKVKSIKTEGKRLHPKGSEILGVHDNLENGNFYLNSVYMSAYNIKNSKRYLHMPLDSEDGKIDAMSKVMTYLRSIKV